MYNSLDIKVILNYPYLTEPWGYGNQYSTMLLIPQYRKDIIDKIKTAMDKAVQQGNFMGGQPIKLPLRDWDKEYPDNDMYNNMYFLIATTKEPLRL